MPPAKDWQGLRGQPGGGAWGPTVLAGVRGHGVRNLRANRFLLSLCGRISMQKNPFGEM